MAAVREPETFSMTDSAITARADVYARAIGQISLFIIGIIVTIYQMWSIRAVALRGWVGGCGSAPLFLSPARLGALHHWPVGERTRFFIPYCLHDRPLIPRAGFPAFISQED